MDLFSANALVSLLILSLSVFFVFKKTGNVSANRWLAFTLFLLANLVFLFAIIMTEDSPFKSAFFDNKIYLIGWFGSFAYYPALFIFVRKSIGLKEKFKWSIALHFVFPLLQMGYLLYLFIFYREIFDSVDNDLRTVSTSWDNPYMALPRLMINFVNVFYKVWALIILRKYFIKLKDFASANVKVHFIWIKQLLIVTMITHSAIMAYFTAVRDSEIMDFFPLTYIIIIYFIVVKAINQPKLFDELHFESMSKRLSPESGNAEFLDRGKEDFKIINDYVLAQKAHIQNSISVKELSELTDVPAYRITIALKTHQLNFFDYINQLRVESAKTILQDQSQKALMIDDIADEVGFQSRVTLTQAFKKYEKSTPHAFRIQSRLSSEKKTA
ncbi:MAG: AraC family transcriptional regulator [Crocinitomicaceae bacterium]|nr:AraC family transcriptional regulator [Crocinitomicaceae bacterium]